MASQCMPHLPEAMYDVQADVRPIHNKKEQATTKTALCETARNSERYRQKKLLERSVAKLAEALEDSKE